MGVELLTVLIELVVVGGLTGLASLAEKRFWKNAAHKANRLQMVDILILAAVWDRVVTAAERAALEEGLRELLKRIEAEPVDDVVERWMAHFDEPGAEPREAALARLAGPLSAAEKAETFEVVVRLLVADHEANAAPASGAFRSAEAPQLELVRIFGHCLGATDAAMEDAHRKLGAAHG